MYETKIVELEEYRKTLAAQDTGDEDDEDLKIDIFELSRLIDEARQDKSILSVTYEQLKEESRIRLVQRKRTSLARQNQEEKSAQEIGYEKQICRLQSAEYDAERKAMNLEDTVADRDEEIRELNRKLSLATASRKEKKKAAFAYPDFWGWISRTLAVTEWPATQKPRRSESFPSEPKDSRISRGSRPRDSSRSHRPHREKKPSRSDTKSLPSTGVRTQSERAYHPEQDISLSEHYAYETECGQTETIPDIPYPSGTVISTATYATIPQPTSLSHGDLALFLCTTFLCSDRKRQTACRQPTRPLLIGLIVPNSTLRIPHG